MLGVQRAGEGWQVILVADSVARIMAGAIALVAYLLPTKRVVVTNAWNVTPGAPGAPFGLSLTLSAF